MHRNSAFFTKISEISDNSEARRAVRAEGRGSNPVSDVVMLRSDPSYEQPVLGQISKVAITLHLVIVADTDTDYLTLLLYALHSSALYCCMLNIVQPYEGDDLKAATFHCIIAPNHLIPVKFFTRSNIEIILSY